VLTFRNIVSTIPPDLRIINKPLLKRLSPASAGLPGDDAIDIQVIRDEWIRNKARSLVKQGIRGVSLRLGTFNVNGKLPSQDLSSWIQGITASNPLELNNVVSPSSPEVKASPPISAEDVILTSNGKVYHAVMCAKLDINFW
jgi:phosphatidylinositol-bisphosphatase